MLHPAWIAWGNWIWYGTVALAIAFIWYLATYKRRKQK